MYKWLIIILTCCAVSSLVYAPAVEAEVVNPNDLGPQPIPLQSPSGEIGATTEKLEYTPIVDLPGKTGLKQPGNLLEYIQVIFTLMLTIAGIAAVVMIIVGGIQYMAGGAIPSQLKQAKSRIWSAIGGLVLAIAAWLILNTINPDLLSLRFSVSEIQIKTEGEAAQTPEWLAAEKDCEYKQCGADKFKSFNIDTGECVCQGPLPSGTIYLKKQRNFGLGEGWQDVILTPMTSFQRCEKRKKEIVENLRKNYPQALQEIRYECQPI